MIEAFNNNKVGVPTTSTPIPTIDCIVTKVTIKKKLINSENIIKNLKSFIILIIKCKN